MTDVPRENESHLDDFAELEQAIFAARNYVVPSATLRPRILEAAREAVVQRIETRRVGVVSLVAFALWLACWPLSLAVNQLRDRVTGPTSVEIERQAAEFARNSNSGIDWGLVEAFDRADALTGKR